MTREYRASVEYSTLHFDHGAGLPVSNRSIRAREAGIVLRAAAFTRQRGLCTGELLSHAPTLFAATQFHPIDLLLSSPAAEGKGRPRHAKWMSDQQQWRGRQARDGERTVTWRHNNDVVPPAFAVTGSEGPPGAKHIGMCQCEVMPAS